MKTISRRQSIKMLSAFGLAAMVPTQLLSQVLTTSCDVCKKAWNSLGRFNKTRYQFRYIEPVAALPKVFIYGDSISIGYTEYVRASLKGKACVYRLHTNGQSSNEFVERFEKLRHTMFQPFLKAGWNFKWDVIHFNVGLHDLKYLHEKKLNKKEGTQVSTLDLYEKNLRAIIQYLKNTYPKAKLIFATTTPVPEGEPGRVAGDAVTYNAVALKVMREYPEIIVNDLYTFSIPVLKEFANKPGDVHYKPEGSRLQGIEVANKIANAINITPVECPSAEVITAKFKEYESKR
ncbi:SGNH/GDSL hydrolase family protein [Lacinutrix sp. C3R15]|uniref:SGNH/GDSL hydrolase family protein n=1 Tax=Flavobacteriaceae TaxID=49546 RepID=UPI001C08BB64|nr:MULTISPECIES: SGNH/GDSL hydrolase family protein [Flavobacteriaceae]MBU2939200.1 SGNH/GDSL hydrolase family protein [Lacinutrix sp. C3R15]MDO6622516.1 SGNH/GDSL hydrolase family protein [Oceanihabitans sp. 1_MG-2023]